MHPPDPGTVVVRHGEIGVKSEQVRRRMERLLRDNVDALMADRGIDGRVQHRRNRLLIFTDDPEAACDAATDAFGVVSASPARRVDPTIEAITDALTAAARAHYRGGTFALRARRAGESDAHPFSSRDLESEGGAAVWEAAEDGGADPEVDLDDPDIEFFVDCREDEAFVFLEKRPGPGGLPLGSQDPLVALFSGGIDSPVAAWEAMRRGAPVVPLYVSLGEYGGVDREGRAQATASDLARYAPDRDLRLRVAPAGDLIEDVVTSVDGGRMLVVRRAMYRIAEHVARDADAVGIVTGESVGQKSSQTTANLAATSAAVDLPVHRPLLTADKTDITQRAREVGTYRDSTVPAGCNQLVPEYPETRGRPEEIAALEPDDVDGRTRAIADRIEVLDTLDAPAGGETA